VGGVILPSIPIPLISPPSTIVSPSFGGQPTHFHFPTPPAAHFGSPPVIPSPIPFSPMLPTSPSLMYNPAIGGFYYTAFPFPFVCPPASNLSGYTPPDSGSSSSTLPAGSIPAPYAPPRAPPSLPSSNSSCSGGTVLQPLQTNLNVPPVIGSLAPRSTAATGGPPVLPPVCCINVGPPPTAAASKRGSFSTTSTLTAEIRSHILQENLKQSPFSIDSILASQRK
jgi:hypothetical protein